MSSQMSVRLVLLMFVVLASGCATQPYDYTALNNSKPRSILVMPPLNNTVEVIAPYTFLSTISQPLAEKGYYVFPVAMVDSFFKENGLPTTAEMNQAPLDKIREVFGADAVLYVEIGNWGQEYQLLSSKTVVSSNWRLVDAKDGTLLCDGTASAVQSSSDGGGGLVGALVGAVVSQIASSMNDMTPELSKTANVTVINNQSRGLLPGPYKPTRK